MIFLGGSCRSNWRDDFMKKLDTEGFEYFNPVVDDWNEEAYQHELKMRRNALFCMYTITPMINGYYSIAEVVDDSNKRPFRTVLVLLLKDGGEEFSHYYWKSLKRVGELVANNGGVVFYSLEEALDFFKVRLVEDKWRRE